MAFVLKKKACFLLQYGLSGCLPAVLGRRLEDILDKWPVHDQVHPERPTTIHFHFHRHTNWQISQSQHPLVLCADKDCSMTDFQNSRKVPVRQFNLLLCFLFFLIETVKATHYSLIQTYTCGYCETEMTKLFHWILAHWEDLSLTRNDFAKVIACRILNL